MTNEKNLHYQASSCFKDTEGYKNTFKEKLQILFLS